MSTTIEWTDATWNPVRGCSRVSPGCVNCYAERIAARGLPGLSSPTTGDPFAVMTPSGPHWTGKVELIEHKVEEPLHWRKPRRVFVNSMSDLFHESLPFWAIDKVFSSMAAAPEHTYQILTKRHGRMFEYFHSGRHDGGYGPSRAMYHLDQNIWLGVSVEDRARKDRIDTLRRVPATVRFLSLEPLLEDLGKLNLTGIGWCIVGGESGPGARGCDVAWIRSIVQQCKAAGVACFCKQTGASNACEHDRKGGCFDCLPDDLKVREYPENKFSSV
jgi:protein gp37